MEQELEKEKQRIKERHKQTDKRLDEMIITGNSFVIMQELHWLQELLDARISEIDGKLQHPAYFSSMSPPVLTGENSTYAQLVKALELSAAERLMLVCSLVPHISPEIFTNRLRKEGVNHLSVHYPQLGGYFDNTFTTFVPTFQTVLYLLAGNDMTNTLYYHLSLSREGKLVKEQVITLAPVASSEDTANERNYAVALAPEYVNYLLSGDKPRPDFGRAFPASLVRTDLTWDELVLDELTHDRVKEVMNWLAASKKLNSTRKIKKGFPCLFFGPPGTGKTLTAQLIGKTYGKDVFRIDLSMVVSKYVGETEKNLAHLFDRAENKDCILFFDEADSLFTRRTEVSSSNDKWANLEVAYLLQKMEEYPGLTILATNLKSNLDPAMTRRFQAMIFFPRPKKEEREKLWKLALPEGFAYAENISFDKLSEYDLTGANISNIIKYCCVACMARSEVTLSGRDLLKGIIRELAKENRTP